MSKKIVKVLVRSPFTLTLGSKHFGAGETLTLTVDELKGQEHKIEYCDLAAAKAPEVEQDAPEQEAEAEVINNRAVPESKVVAPRIRKATVAKKRK